MAFFVEWATRMSLQHLMLAPLRREISSCSDTCLLCNVTSLLLLFRPAVVPGRVVSSYCHGYNVLKPPNKKTFR